MFECQKIKGEKTLKKLNIGIVQKTTYIALFFNIKEKLPLNLILIYCYVVINTTFSLYE